MAGQTKGKGIPDWLSLIGPLGNLLFQPDFPEIPNLSEFGLDPKQLRGFFNLKRAITRSGIFRGASDTARKTAGALPSSLSQSTIPASFTADIFSKAEDQAAQAEAAIAGEEISAYAQAYQLMLQKFGIEADIAKEKRGGISDIFEIASFLPLIL